MVVSAGVMDLDQRGRFHSRDTISRGAVAESLARAVVLAVPEGSGTTLPEARARFLDAMGVRGDASAPASRDEVALALARFVGPGW